ncbi:tyrosine-type recombinase/integrase [Amycolatopsis sp. NPDC051372]|uniref:tyrosine-type recombinase/integrase n=1 Tax=Amycolatopsis sp. NPDC051372 TaxID=3155669 RepID=UPI00341542FA
MPEDASGNRRPRRRVGFDSATDAQTELTQVRNLLGIPDDDDVETRRKIADLIAEAIGKKTKLPDVEETRRLVKAGADVSDDPRMDEVLEAFLATKLKAVERGKLARNTYRSYESHDRLYLRPHLGGIRQRKLRVHHLDSMYEAIIENNERIAEFRQSGDQVKIAAVKWQRPVGPTSLHKINGTLKTVLSPAEKSGILLANVAKLVELPALIRPTPLVWTPERVLLWRQTGLKPGPVMVWTPDQTGVFLDVAVNHPLYPLFHVIAHVGLRRGEACGQRRSECYLDAGTLNVTNQIVQWGWETAQTKPKTTNSEGIVALDADSVLVLRLHLALQDADKARLGSDWHENDLMFPRSDGSPLHPAEVTDAFYDIVERASLPPIRLHDLRHGAATLALAAGVEMKVVQNMLRHSSITTTSDIYTSVLPQVAFAAAEATAAIIPRQSARSLGLFSGSHVPDSVEVFAQVDRAKGGSAEGWRGGRLL